MTSTYVKCVSISRTISLRGEVTGQQIIDAVEDLSRENFVLELSSAVDDDFYFLVGHRSSFSQCGVVVRGVLASGCYDINPKRNTKRL